MAIDLRAYADESGTHDDPSHCVLAGWIGSPRQWRLFDEAWGNVLTSFEVPNFHSKEFFQPNARRSPTNPYRGWSDHRASEFIDTLTNVIAERHINPVGGAVNVRDFMSYSESERRYFTDAPVTQSGRITGVISGSPNKPYHLGVMIFLTEAAQAARDDITVHFIFDRNEIESSYAIQAFNQIKEQHRNELWGRLGEITFADRSEQLGLQAADLYAHLWYAFWEHGAEGMGVERHRVWQSVKKRRDWMKVADRELLFEPLLGRPTPTQRSRLNGSPS